MIREIVRAFCLCTLTALASGQSPAYLAYIEPGQEIELRAPQLTQSACIFMGSYEGGRFIEAPEISGPDPDLDKAMNRIVRAFPSKQLLMGADSRGGVIQGVVKTADPESINSLGEVTLRVNIHGRTTPRGGALLGTRTLAIRVLRRQPARLAPAVDAVLRMRAEELWQKHLPERAVDERPSRYTLKSPIVERVESVPGVLTVLYPMDIEEDNLNGDGKIVHDDRGVMFFIYSEADRKMIRGDFGHPEWSSSSTVWTIKPELFFRLGTNSDVFFVGVSKGGWESIGHGIFDLRTGRKVLSCY